MDAANPRRNDRYTTVAIILHWLIALCIIALLVMGIWMTTYAKGYTQFQLFQLHKSVGITVLVLSLFRLGWRLAHPAPPLPADMPRWEKIAARSTHVLFYVLMIGMPLSGWALVSTSSMKLPTVLYGVVTLPHLPGLDGLPDQHAANRVFDTMHVFSAWVVIGLLCLHVGAALMHQFIRRDEVPHHMIPFLKPRVEP
jgi:cytochrome b561